MNIESDEPDFALEDMPLPRDPHTLILLGIFLMMLLYMLHILSEIVLPILMAVLLYLLLQPSMRLFIKLKMPKVIAALLAISMLCGGVVGLTFTLSEPVAEWVGKAPKTLPKLEKRMSALFKPIEQVRQVSEQVEKMGDGSRSVPPSIKLVGPSLGSLLATGTRAIVAGVLVTVVLLFFMLVSGDLFLRRFVEILPTMSNKKQVVSIAHEIESHISSYLLTISLMNVAVGIATGLAVYACGLTDPILWGTVAFLLNYVLILGPVVCALILTLAGLSTFDSTWQALLPGFVYIGIHFIEGESITPFLLARRLTLNPVLIIVSLVFWYWMWGVIGAFLAVPLLGALKIVCDRIRPLRAIGHFLGTEART